ncbi:Uncharacterised protein [Cedecea neteri]|uniref:Uncharacterized protein n=1 Tax=Cedecea neteri TaxID=158822 RepID=A0A291DXM0_9ENTR|nr:hypothetical protein [Cedecea neteri]ATF92432.1 hypothetical protein CO704_10215 [Cedecea neteri]SQC92487.1 Uncharacterised protein [Cedecea neteri]
MIKTALKYIVLWSYFTAGFFLLGVVIKVVLGVFYMNAFYLPCDEVVRNFFKSMIAASAITLAAIIFNLIDKLKGRKPSSSDSN